MRKTSILVSLTAACVLLGSWVPGQDSAELRKKLEILKAYPQLIVYNGKIHIMDEKLSNVQAMAVRDERVVALGANDEIKVLAGPDTQMLDVKGRTVLPGLIDTHTHPHAWLVPHRLSNGDAAKYDPQLKITYARGKTPQEVVNAVEQAIKSRARELGPGQWIWITMYPDAAEASLGPRDENLDEAKEMAVSILQRNLITSALLDRMAPDNPVIVFAPTVTGASVSNTRAKEIMKRVLGSEVSGLRARYLLPYDIILQGRDEAIADLLEMEMSECLTAKGVTTIGSHIESLATLRILSRMDRRGQLPLRWGWVHRIGYSFAQDPANFYRVLGDFRGQGSDFFWNIGAGGEGWEDRRTWACTQAKALNPNEPRRWGFGPCAPDFSLDKGTQSSPMYQGMRATLESGLRMTFLHAYVDGTYDAIFYMIDEAIRDGKLTLEQVKEARITLEHNMVVRPDQVEKLAKYGIMLSFQGFQLHSSEKGGAFLSDYGEQYMKWLMPVKSLADAGVPLLFGTDHHLTRTRVEAKSLTGVPVSWEDSIWPYYEFFVTREIDGKIFSPEQAVDRVTVLRGATTWAAQNLLREKDLGSLEAGKLADFIVIDKDYFTIPVREIHSIQNLITAVGGKIVYRSNEF